MIQETNYLYYDFLLLQLLYKVSFAYQFSAILGGLSPLIASSLLALGGGKPWYVALFLFAVSVLSFVCVWLIEPTDEQETASYRYIREQSHEN